MRGNGYISLYSLMIGGLLLSWPFLQPFMALFQDSPQPAPTPVTPPPKSAADIRLRAQKLEKYLTVEAALLNVSDNISLYFKSLNDQSEVAIQSTRSWIPASTIKSFVVLEAFRQRRSNILDFNKKVTISADNVVSTELETSDYPTLTEGTQVTIQQLLEMMITQSDNTAYNTLLDILDRRNINNTLKSLGLTETVVGQKLNLDDNQFQKDLLVPGYQPNTTTVKDFAALFDLLYNQKVQNSDEILAIFKKQKINNMIPALLPQGVTVAHKTGDWAPIYHDGGVVYKSDDPFILTIFTNSNDPSIIAKLAKVAYFQNVQVVGEGITSTNSKPVVENRLYTKTVLASLPTTNVLAAETDTKVPQVTAEDLGITEADINTNLQAAQKIQSALIVPGSLLYDLKKWWEGQQLNQAQTDSQKVTAYIAASNSRMSELKTALQQGQVTQAKSLLDQSEQDLKQAADQAMKDNKSADINLLQVKQSSDLHFSALAEAAAHVPANQKEQFIDLVYNYYQKDKAEVKSVVQTSLVTNPLQQQPIIGIVQKVDQGQVTLKFDDGSQKQVNVNNYTPIRAFQQTTLDKNQNSIEVGSKIAVVGQTTKEGVIVPQFILRSLPKAVPEKHEGVILEVDPKNSTLKIQDQGQVKQVQIEDSTVVKSKDTSVSLEGISVGSTVTVFGQQVGGSTISTPSATPKSSSNPTTKINNQGKSSYTPIPTSNPNQTKQSIPTPTTQIKQNTPLSTKVPSSTSQPTTQPVIKATTVTVIKNNPSPPAPKKEESKSTPKPAATKK